MKTDFIVFSEELRKKLTECMGEEFSIELTEVTKNNGQIYHGISIRSVECNIAPTIYIDKYFEEYKNDLKSYDEIQEEICEIYERNKIMEDIDVEELLSFGNIKDKIICELINYDQNKELLEQVPYIPFHDLAVVFRILCTIDEQETGTILITHAHKASWGEVSDQELFDIAKANTIRLLGCEVTEISQILKRHYDELDDKVLEEMFDDMVPLYVMSNKHCFKGASSLLHTEKLEEFALEHQTDFYILPSSVHEVILLPTVTDENTYSLKEMVSQINQSEVSVEDRLSNHIYFYALGSNKVTLVA